MATESAPDSQTLEPRAARCEELGGLLQSTMGFSAEQNAQLYDCWAENYEQDMSAMEFTAPQLAVDFLSASFRGSREEARVLDVACGSGLVAKLMAKLGFRHFTGVDASRGMLEQAAGTGLYRDLKLALLGPQRLPTQPGAFDVVILVGALDDGFIPVSVVRELCLAAKPGGYICMIRGDHPESQIKYKEDLEAELRRMEEEELWRAAGIKHTGRYMKKRGATGKMEFISGKVYLFKRDV